MINLTKIDGNPITVNADEIETVETFHDTIINMKSGKRVLCRESANDITDKVIEYKRLCYSKLFIVKED